MSGGLVVPVAAGGGEEAGRVVNMSRFSIRQVLVMSIRKIAATRLAAGRRISRR
ncbi:MAG: hypothetical protein LBV34_08110 [Nocardiopsaceae bacterium]|nr:hypothetical protein [Nocardiopsaceae bacterium]